VHYGRGMDGSLWVWEGHQGQDRCHTDHQNVLHYTNLGSDGVAAVEGYQKAGHHIQNHLDNSEAVRIAVMVVLDDPHMYLGVEYLHKAVVEGLKVRRKMAVGWEGERIVEIDSLHKYLGVGCLRRVAVGRLKASRKLAASFGVALRKEYVVSCRTEVEVGSGSRSVVAVDCMMLLRSVDRRLVVLNQNSHPVAHYEMNSHKRLPAI
jgi:hypothetical protein